MNPICIHPENERVFLFRGKPALLLCATEHYGSVMNRPFDYRAYIEEAKDKLQNYTRLFLLFREQQIHCNPYSTCKPESPDYISPFMRVGPGKAKDGEPVYDVSAWNPEFFGRLTEFIGLASDAGIVVEVVLFSNTYCDTVWDLNPLNSPNNVNGLEHSHWADYNTLTHPKLNAVQERLVRKVVTELNGFDNIVFEPCNEPGGQFAPETATVSQVNEWLEWVVSLIRETEASLPNKHLIFGQEAFAYDPMTMTTTLSYEKKFPVDVVNVHPLPNTVLRGRSYDLGAFMSRELKLSEMRDYCLAAGMEGKPLCFDEDNTASCYKDRDGWLIHRKRAWTTLMNLSHYDMIDFSIINYSPAGTPDSRANLRTWFKNLAKFVSALPMEKAEAFMAQGCWEGDSAVVSAFSAGDAKYFYVADDTELVFAKKPEYKPVKGALTFDLKPGDYLAYVYSPEAGVCSTAMKFTGGPGARVELPPFYHDIAVCAVPVQ